MSIIKWVLIVGALLVVGHKFGGAIPVVKSV